MKIIKPDFEIWNQEEGLEGVIDKEDAVRARLEAEIKYFDKYKSKVLNNEID